MMDGLDLVEKPQTTKPNFVRPHEVCIIVIEIKKFGLFVDNYT